MKNRLSIVIAALSLFCSASAFADNGSFRAQARLFFGFSFADPAEVNTMMQSQGLQKFDKIGNPGVEITYPVASFLDVGLRYAFKFNTMFQDPNNISSNYGGIKQHAILLVARVPIIRSSNFKLDVFAGAGGTNSTFELKTPGFDGKFTKSATDDWFASPYFAAGASTGVGMKDFFLFAEVGLERNNVTKLTPSGTVPGSLSAIALSGPYAMVGILFDGITVRKQ